MTKKTWKTFEDIIRQGRNRSIKAKLAMDDDDDDVGAGGVCLTFLPDTAVQVWMRGVMIKFY